MQRHSRTRTSSNSLQHECPAPRPRVARRSVLRSLAATPKSKACLVLISWSLDVYGHWQQSLQTGI